jgi:acetylornithine deacetylase/succinyl-diaminopimelate desuccinylase-like protein
MQRIVQESMAPLDQDGYPLNRPTLVIPGLLMGRTDSVHLRHLSENGVMRFSPLALNRAAGDIRWHGVDERIRVTAFTTAIPVFQRGFEVLSEM